MSQQTPSLSFEVFPPNPAVGNEKILQALESMQTLAPHFISVTASNNKSCHLFDQGKSGGDDCGFRRGRGQAHLGPSWGYYS